jgi:hypothetical protein
MSAWVGWALALAALAVGGFAWGWQGLVLAFTLVVFWLLLQFSRALRVMRGASATPVGQVPSAVMLNAKLHPGMTLLQVIAITRSLGHRISEMPEVWSWSDPGGAAVAVTLEHGRVVRWTLQRPGDEGVGP